MKLLAPEGVTGIGLDGVEHFVKDGIIDVAEKWIAHLVESFGFKHVTAEELAPPVDEADLPPVVVDAPAVFDPAALGRNQLFAELKKLGIAVALPITNGALRVILSKAVAESNAAPAEPAPAEVVVVAPAAPEPPAPEVEVPPAADTAPGDEHAPTE